VEKRQAQSYPHSLRINSYRLLRDIDKLLDYGLSMIDRLGEHQKLVMRWNCGSEPISWDDPGVA
jgi:hypothetical protein